MENQLDQTTKFFIDSIFHEDNDQEKYFQYLKELCRIGNLDAIKYIKTKCFPSFKQKGIIKMIYVALENHNLLVANYLRNQFVIGDYQRLICGKTFDDPDKITNVETLKYLITEWGVLNHCNKDNILIYATRCQNFEISKLLLDNLQYQKQDLLLVGLDNIIDSDNIETLKYYMGKYFFTADNILRTILKAKYGKTKCLKFLFDRIVIENVDERFLGYLKLDEIAVLEELIKDVDIQTLMTAHVLAAKYCSDNIITFIQQEIMSRFNNLRNAISGMTDKIDSSVCLNDSKPNLMQFNDHELDLKNAINALDYGAIDRLLENEIDTKILKKVFIHACEHSLDITEYLFEKITFSENDMNEIFITVFGYGKQDVIDFLVNNM